MDTPTQQDYMDVTNLLVGHYTQSNSHMGVSISTGHKDPSQLFFFNVTENGLICVVMGKKAPRTNKIDNYFTFSY